MTDKTTDELFGAMERAFETLVSAGFVPADVATHMADFGVAAGITHCPDLHALAHGIYLSSLQVKQAAISRDEDAQVKATAH